ncbi:MAG: signal peptidase II [Acidimicrobiales bacterium]
MRDEQRLWIRAAVVVVVGMLADQVTKWLAIRGLQDRGGINLLPTLELNLHYNSGFSFGTGQGAGQLIGVVVIAMSIYLINLIRKERGSRRSLILAIILSGALGNLSDRIWRADSGPLSGKVVDFIDVTWFAIFNVADIFVVGGVIVFALFEMLDTYRAAKAEQTAAIGAAETTGQADPTLDEIPANE